MIICCVAVKIFTDFTDVTFPKFFYVPMQTHFFIGYEVALFKFLLVEYHAKIVGSLNVQAPYYHHFFNLFLRRIPKKENNFKRSV